MNDDTIERLYVVRVLSRLIEAPISANGVLFDPQVDMNHADAVLCVGNGSEDLFLAAKVPRAWWAMEALSHSIYRKGKGRLLTENLQLREWLHFAHPDVRFRVPVYTHIHNFVIGATEGRRNKAVAVVANTGGRWWWTKPGIRFRNRFILNKHVDIFGPKENWEAFSRYGFFSRSGCPANYAGGLPGANMCRGTIEKMAEYKVVVCMENTCEPWYFTEKFVQAVQAGTIPVYRAHPTVRNGILCGAKWIDPADHGFSVDRTLEAALGSDLRRFQDQNAKWFQSKVVAGTHLNQVWKRVAEIMKRRIEYPHEEDDTMAAVRGVVSFKSPMGLKQACCK